MEISFQNLTTSGPTVHGRLSKLPHQRENADHNPFPRPVLAMQTNSGIRVIGDAYRFEEARKLGTGTIPCYLVREIPGNLELLQLLVDYYQPMSLADQALLLAAAVEMGVNQELLQTGLLPGMGLSRVRGTIDELLEISRFPDALLTFIEDKGLSLKRTRVLVRMREMQDWCVRFLEELHPGVNVLLEVVQNLWEVGQRDDRELSGLPTDLGIEKYLTDPDHPAAERLAALRRCVHEHRYPELTGVRRKLENQVRELDLPSNLNLRWDPNFEERGLVVQGKLRSPEDAAKLESILRSPSFLTLFEQL